MIINYTDVRYLSVVTSKHWEGNEDEVRSFEICLLRILSMDNHDFII